MNYKEELKRYLTNVQGHLDGEYAEDTTADGILFGTAMELSYSGQIGSKIASVILFHQTTIGLMKQIIIRCNFLVKLLIFPNEMKYKKLKDNDSFSTVYRTLDNHISFIEKGKFLVKIQEINMLRTQIAHNMHKEEVDVFVIENTSGLKSKFENLWELYIKASRDLNQKINKASKRKEILTLVND